MIKRFTIWPVMLILCFLLGGISAQAAGIPTIRGVYEDGIVTVSGEGFPANTTYPMIAILRADNPPDSQPAAIGFTSTDSTGKLSLQMVTGDSLTEPTQYCVCVYREDGKAVAQGAITVAARFTITLNSAGGACEVTTLITDENGRLPLLPSAIRAHYLFNGWYLADTTTRVNLSTVFAADTTITADWTFNGDIYSNGDSFKSDNSRTQSDTVLKKDISVAIPTKNNEDGSATVTISAAEAKRIINEAVKHHSENVTIRVNDPTNLTHISASMPQSVVKDLFDKTAANLIVVTPLATITFAAETVGQLASLGSQTIGLHVTKSEDTFQIALQAEGESLSSLGDVTVALPIEQNAGMGTVAILVHPDSSETIIKDSIPVNGMMSLALPDWNGSATIRIRDNGKSFPDTTQHWAADAIQFVTGRELFHGVSETSFEPNAPMTRAMLVTVLYRLEDLPASETATFPDIAAGLWYSEAVAWAGANQIVTGNPDGNFCPDEPITREQLATMLFRYATSTGRETHITSHLETFTDRNQVANYAKEAMTWAVEKHIVSGKSTDTLNPKENATRAEVATMLMRLLQNR